MFWSLYLPLIMCLSFDFCLFFDLLTHATDTLDNPFLLVRAHLLSEFGATSWKSQGESSHPCRSNSHETIKSHQNWVDRQAAKSVMAGRNGVRQCTYIHVSFQVWCMHQRCLRYDACYVGQCGRTPLSFEKDPVSRIISQLF